jgi:hypothetical protein
MAGQSASNAVAASDRVDYHRHLAAEIVATLPYVRADAWAVLREVVDHREGDAGS